MKIELTAQRLRELLAYDPETGLFTHLKNRGQRARVGGLVGHKPIQGLGYSRVPIDSVGYYAHRLAWLHVYGEWPKHHIDHIDGNRMNNRIANLRDVPQAVNVQNRKSAHANNKGLMGVRKREAGTFTSKVTLAGMAIHLGTFSTAEAAHQAYLVGKRKFHEGCTI